MTDGATAEASARPGERVAVRTFLIADVRGYTSFTLAHGDAAAARLASKMAAITREIVAAHEGEVIELRGDEALAVFASARQALWAAAALQGRFRAELLSDPSLPLKVGIGLDAGEAIAMEGGFRGTALNLAARLCSLAGPGEVLASETVTSLARKIEGLVYGDRGTAPLKGFGESVRIYAVLPEDPEADDGRSHSSEVAVRKQSLPIGGFLGSLPSGELVSRENELKAALAFVDQVEQGTGRLLLLAGEPGVGKTRLAQEISLHLRDRGFVIGAGSCYEARQTSACFPFLEALASLYDLAPAALQSQVPHRWPYLEALLPSETFPALPSSGEGSQDRLLWAVSGFVRALAEGAPIGLLIDDLHWADNSSLELLQHLARQTRSDRVFILGTYRDVEVGRQHPLETTLQELSRQGLRERILIRRLPPDGAAALAVASLGEQEIGEEFSEFLYERTEGNPFFLQQVLRDLVERGDLYREGDAWERRALAEILVPESIRAAIGQRLTKLSEETQDILREASVLGHSFLFDDLRAMSDREEDDAERALEEAMTIALVQERDGDRYAFDHALTQQSLYAELSARRKRRLHLAAAETLERLPERNREKRVAELAWHFLHAGHGEKALRYSLQAGDAAEAIYAHADAEMQYRTAIELAREQEDEESEALAFEQLARVLYITARYIEQLEVAGQAAELYRKLGDLEGEGRVVARTARAYHGLNRTQEGIKHLEPLLRRFEGRPPSPAHFALCEDLVTLYMRSGAHAEAEEASERALAMARTLGDDGLMARAQGRRGLVLSQTEGREAEQEETQLEAIALAETVGDLHALWFALHNMTGMYEARGEWRRARAYYDRTLEIGRRMGNPDLIVRSLAERGWALTWEGDLAGRRASQEEILQIAHHTGLQSLSWALTIPGQMLMEDGMAEEARAHFASCVADAERTGNELLLDVARGELANLDRLEGRLDAARAWYESAQGPLGEDRTMLLVDLAAILLEMNNADATQDARKALDEALASRHLRTFLWRQLAAAALSAWLQARDGNREEALRMMEETLAAVQPSQPIYLQAEILVWYGLMLGELGETAAAQQRVTQAIEGYHDLGLVMEQRRAERLLGVING